MHGATANSVTTRQYINHKIKVLRDFGLTNKEKIRSHLVNAISDISDPRKREMKIDRVAQDMIIQSFEGSREFR